MTDVSMAILEKFADTFAGAGSGFSADEIVSYFEQYGIAISKDNGAGGVKVRRDLFCEAVRTLEPKMQYYALTDLCKCLPATKYSIDTNAVDSLQMELHTSLGAMPIGLCFSALSEKPIRTAYFECLQRIADDPAAAITAARTLLETTAKTVIAERGLTPDDSGNLVKLVKQAETVLGIGGAATQDEHQIIAGLSSVVTGVAAISNAAGDRHGSVGGVKLEDEEMATLIVNACGTLAAFLVNRHLLAPKA